MDNMNKNLRQTVFASTAIVLGLSLGMGVTASAHEGGYASGGDGSVLRDGSGNCVTATHGNAYPECEPEVVIEKPVPKPVVKVVVPPPAPVKVAVVKPKPVYVTKTLSLNEASGANFGFDNDSLSSNAQQQLATFASTVRKSNINPSSVSVVGHTDSIGPESYNQTLSERRANSVASYLSNQGIDRTVMQVSGRGESQPVASNKSKEGRAQNRRVDIKVTGQRTMTIKK